MIDVETKKKLIKDMDKLSIEMQKRVQEFAHSLLLTQPKGTPGKELLKFSSILSDEEADKIKKYVNEGCERVDLNEW